jgi:membrane fusion protein, multidrug efflux system
MKSSAHATALDAPAPIAASDLPHARTAKTTKKRSPVRVIVFTVIGLAILGWGGRFAVHAFHYEETDDAFVAGRLHAISPQIDGQVKEVLVDDNQVVRAGEVLARLDPLQFEIAVQKADAALAQAQAQEKQLVAAVAQADAALLEVRARVTQAEAQLTQTVAQANLAKVTLTRNEQLARTNGVSEADLDQARSAFQAAEAAHHAAEANLVAARAAVGSAEAAQVSARAQGDAARAAIAAAEAARRDAQRQLDYTAIVAPTAGRIGNQRVEAGNRVQAGQPLFALAEPDTWIIANFKETQLARMHAGQPVELTVDALPDTELSGKLDSVSPASGAEFALLPPDNATGNFNKVVQRVPVKIILDPASRRELGDRLRLGLSVIVNVRVR